MFLSKFCCKNILSFLVFVYTLFISGNAVALCSDPFLLPEADKKYFNPFTKTDLPPTIDSLVISACPTNYEYTGLWRYITEPTESNPDPSVVLACYRDAYKACKHGGSGHCDPSITVACGACDGSSNILVNRTPIVIPYCYGERVKHICKISNVDNWYRCERKYFIGVPPQQCPKVANPCVPSTGNKIETETDYVAANGVLQVKRYYKSQDIMDGTNEIGRRWRHNYSQRVDGLWEWNDIKDVTTISPLYNTPQSACTTGWNSIKDTAYRGVLSGAVAGYSNGICALRRDGQVVARLVIHNSRDTRKDYKASVPVLEINRSNGSFLTFVKVDGHWENVNQGLETLQENGSDLIITDRDGTTLEYDADGLLISKQYQNGTILTYTYDSDDKLLSVADQLGGQLQYQYNGQELINTIITPDGNINYQYDPEGRLVLVVYPDNSEKTYHYEDSDFPYHLTGITDENSTRFATWQYDEEGKAIVSEHTGGAERTEFTYNPDGTTTVTDAKGAQQIYHFVVQQGAMKVDHIEGDRCTTCAGGDTQAYTYDSNGFTASKTDWNGNTTIYTRDDQGRELSRTEASGTPLARTITTTWDVNLNKRLTVTEPDKITEYTYNTEGQLQSQQQRPLE